MATFPTYAKILLDGYAEQRQSALLRTEMESGPPKQAKIKSRVMVQRPVIILLETLADYLAYVEWYKTDINEGASWFDYADPLRGGAVTSMRFVGGGVDAQPAGVSTVWRIRSTIESWGS